MLLVTARRPAVTFTPRESRILDLLRAGLPQKDIAARLDISPWTVKRHLENARRRHRVATTTQLAVLYARTRGARRTS